MVPYFVTIALVMLFSFLAERSRTYDLDHGYKKRRSARTRFLLALAIIPLIFTSGFRYRIGTDFGAYYKADRVFNAEFWDALKNLNEPGILALIWLTKQFPAWNGNYVFTFSLFTVLLSTIVMLRRTEDYLFCLLLYIFCGCWHGSFNGVRQYMAAAVVFLGMRYISERKFIKYAITVFIAFLFHKSAIVMIVPYFVMQNKIRLRNILLLAGGTLVVSMNYDTIFKLIGAAKDQEVVMNTYATASVNILRVLANAAPAIAALVINWRKNLDQEDVFCINGLVINAAAMIAASNSTYLARIGCYTGYFLPLCLSRVMRIQNKYFEGAFRAGIIILFAIFWYVEVSGHPALRVFKWVFLK